MQKHNLRYKAQGTRYKSRCIAIPDESAEKIHTIDDAVVGFDDTCGNNIQIVQV